MPNFIDFSNKTILITGASSGIGRTTALLLDQLGAKCILVARREKELNQTADDMKNAARVYPFDLEKVESIAQWISQIIEENGPLDGYVHCAGIAITSALRGIQLSMLDKSMRINFYSFLEIIKQISRPGQFNENMSIVGISSIAAQQGNSGKTIYSATKAAMDAAVRCLAKELTRKKIRVNSVAPALIHTEIYDNLMERAADSEQVQAVLSRQYLGLGEPVDVANMAVFLLSPASKFTTGATLPVDGGRLSS